VTAFSLIAILLEIFPDFPLCIAPHLYLHSRYVFADQRMSPLAYMRSQELIKIFHEGISRCKVPQMVSTARADLEDKDTCRFRYSPLSSACSRGLHHRREDVKMHRGILSVTVP